MCGIIGYTGSGSAKEKILDGLEILEYRGYDSAGAFFIDQDNFHIVKTKGKVSNLKDEVKKLEGQEFPVGFGHTRWATHGEPSRENAHPHKVGKVTLVHNGIIENYIEIKNRLSKIGYTFNSETDSEVACALIDSYFKENVHPCVTIWEAEKVLIGSYAFVFSFEGCKNELFAIRKGSPLHLGRGSDGFYLASDLTALSPFAEEFYTLKEGEIVEISTSDAKIHTKNGVISPIWEKNEIRYQKTGKLGYSHYMLKEINEQPSLVRSCLSGYIKNGLPNFEKANLSYDALEKIKRIHLVACGSAMHASLLGKRFLEEHAKIPCEVFVASEYRYSPPLFEENTLVILVSQSGETADTIASMRYAKDRGNLTLGIINAPGSTLAKESDFCIYTEAGAELAVATTKGYLTQALVLYLFSVFLSLGSGKINEEKAKTLVCTILSVDTTIRKTLARQEELSRLAKKIKSAPSLFYIGRGLDYYLCLEGALKLKEISYINAQAYEAGELKHGTISLIENGTPVVAFATNEMLFEKTVSNLKETKSRGAYTILFSGKFSNDMDKIADECFLLDGNTREELIFSLIIALQLLAFECALQKGCEIDRPRNLAKSVTVE